MLTVFREDMSRRDHPVLDTLGITVLFLALVATAPGAAATRGAPRARERPSPTADRGPRGDAREEPSQGRAAVRETERLKELVHARPQRGSPQTPKAQTELVWALRCGSFRT